MGDHEHRAIFITGASSGLGRATAKLFASKGWKVIASMRDPKREKELGDISGIALMALDVTDLHEIESVAKQVAESGGVDVVFNNAGYGLAGPLEGLTDDQIVRLANTNMLGTIRTTKAFIPHFREKMAGLFINTTSIGGLIAIPFNSIYHATKWAIEGWSESMAFELNQFGIGIKTIEPGGIRTDFFTRSLDAGHHPAYDAVVKKVMGMITDPKQMETYSSPEQIAEVVYEAATDGKDQLRYVAGADAKTMYENACSLAMRHFVRLWRSSFLAMR